MATYYVSSVDGSNSDNGTTWALAVATLKYAVETLAATGGPHTILVDSAHAESLGAAVTIMAAQDLRIISVNRSGGNAPLAGAVIGTQATNYAITFNGAFKVYCYGIEFQNGTNTNSSQAMIFGSSDGGHFEFESCIFDVNGSTGSYVQIGQASTNGSSYVKVAACEFQIAGQITPLIFGGAVEIHGGSVTGTQATTALINMVGDNVRFMAEGWDTVIQTNPLVGNIAGNGVAEFRFINCKVGATTIMVTPGTVLNKGSISVLLFNCASADTHYSFFHGDAFGETTAVVTYYADDTLPASNNVSWKIVTRANNCSFYTPYVSPWMDRYNSDVSTAITPYIEGLRVGSTTVIQDDEVWAEFSYQGTSGYPQAVLTNDRMALLGTPANQTSTKTYADWSGSPTDTANTDSTFKLAAPSSFTPAEIGDLSARIVVGEPGLTIYIDPVIRT